MHLASLPVPEALPARMARAILAGTADELSVVPTLQRAGFTGREIADGLDAAVIIVDRSRAPAAANPALLQLSHALAAGVTIGGAA